MSTYTPVPESMMRRITLPHCWHVVITDQSGEPMGPEVTPPSIDVLACVAAYRRALPAGWSANAYWGPQ